jgi:hypothetical protein
MFGFWHKKAPLPPAEQRMNLMDAIRSLSTMSERFPFLNAEFIPLNKYHKMFVEKWYLILYQIKDQTAYVDYIVDCRQDYGWLVQ